MTKNKTTILERAIDGARRIIKPMTKEEEYKNADVPVPKTPKKGSNCTMYNVRIGRRDRC